MARNFPFYRQTDTLACGATCLQMIAKFYGKVCDLAELVSACKTNREGTSLLNISEAAEGIGFKTVGVKIPFEELREAVLPCIVYWNQQHFIVVYKIRKNDIYVADPGHGLLTYKIDEFKKSWCNTNKEEGIALLLEPTTEFYSSINLAKSDSDKDKVIGGFKYLFKYLLPFKKMYFQLFLCLLLGSLLQLIFPFLTQSIVDVGIKSKDIGFIYLVLFAQLMLFFSRVIIDIIRNWVLLHISARVNISLVSDFFTKLMKLPLAYFDVKVIGDIMQRVNDNQRIEQFLTGSSLRTLFSMFNLIVFSFVLVWYNEIIFSIFIVGSVLYLLWIVFFLKKRAALDYKLFQQNSQNQGKIVDLLGGMHEIKLHNAERKKRWEWEVLQVKLFKINLKSLSLSQIQNSGSALINELKNILIIFVSARLVIEQEITLGMMLSISYIVGQLNVPILDFVNFIQQWQNAKLSLERLSEINNKPDEELPTKNYKEFKNNSDIIIDNVSFAYETAGQNLVLNNLSFKIPANKITAIIGTSGSGKTTLMKLLLGFYEPSRGSIYIGDVNLSDVSKSKWRKKCGAVLQEAFIFSDTIANNITLCSDEIDYERLQRAAEVANIKEFIEQLPLGYNTKVGIEGNGMSSGQKQRLLIARSVYKNPSFLFFDEATSSLDANNEKIIMGNLNNFFKNRTVIVIAHRLSTVKNADQIIVLDKGSIVESGSHSDLIKKKAFYFELVQNQLELNA